VLPRIRAREETFGGKALRGAFTKSGLFCQNLICRWLNPLLHRPVGKSGLFCQTPRSPAAAATARHGSHALRESGLFCQNPRNPAAAATAHHGLRRRGGAGGRPTASNALIAALRRDSARRS
jgi:hypothetical protein